jgi:hypothetical protein
MIVAPLGLAPRAPSPLGRIRRGVSALLNGSQGWPRWDPENRRSGRNIWIPRSATSTRPAR